jgi:hypothetical protein
MLPRAKSERVGDFLSDNDVVADPPSFNKSLLRRMDVVW